MADDHLEFCELLERASHGDQTAWQMLESVYMPRVKIVLRRRFRYQCQAINRDVEDVLQSVWRRTLASFGELHFRSAEHFLGYFLSCAENLIRHEVRDRHGRRLPEAGDQQDEPSLGENWSVLDIVAQGESLEDVRNRLSPEEFDLLQQRAAGNGWNDIGHIFWMTANRVRWRFQRILKRLRRTLA